MLDYRGLLFTVLQSLPVKEQPCLLTAQLTKGEVQACLCKCLKLIPSLAICVCHEVRLTRQVLFMWACEPVQHLTSL